MDLTGDMAVFFSDFGVSATFGATTGTVLLDTPDSVGAMAGLEVISADVVITYPSSLFATLDEGDSITVAGVSYKAKAVKAVDDGMLSIAHLKRSA